MSHAASSSHHQHLKYLDHKEIDALYWSVFIKGIGDSLISIFTAIYLLHLGFSVRSVAVYYIIYFLIYSLLSRSGMVLGQKFGVKKTLATGIGVFICYYLLLATIKVGMPYQYVAVVYGVGAALYWSSFQLDMARALRVRSAGESLSLIQIVTIASGILGPLLGALMIVRSSFTYLFLVVSLILVCSVLPLLRRGDYKIRGRIASPEVAVAAGSRREAWMYGLYGLTESAVDILWPVFLYLHYPHLVSVGGIISVTSLIMVAILYVNGKIADKNQVRAYKLGVLSNAPTWFLRLLWLTPGGLLAGNLIGAATGSLVNIAVDQRMYRQAKFTDNATAPLLFRNYYSALGRIGILAMVALLNNSAAVFVLVGAVALLQYVASPKTAMRNPNTISA